MITRINQIFESKVRCTVDKYEKNLIKWNGEQIEKIGIHNRLKNFSIYVIIVLIEVDRINGGRKKVK